MPQRNNSSKLLWLLKICLIVSSVAAASASSQEEARNAVISRAMKELYVTLNNVKQELDEARSRDSDSTESRKGDVPEDSLQKHNPNSFMPRRDIKCTGDAGEVKITGDGFSLSGAHITCASVVDEGWRQKIKAQDAARRARMENAWRREQAGNNHFGAGR